MKAATKAVGLGPIVTLDHKRDAYGFAVRPQHVQRYREYANIYKEEEEERSERWESFLERQAEGEPAQLPTVNGVASESDGSISSSVIGKQEENEDSRDGDGRRESEHQNPDPGNHVKDGNKEESAVEKEPRVHRIQIWTEIRPSLQRIEEMMSTRVKKQSGTSKNEKLVEEHGYPKAAVGEDSEDEFYDVEKSESSEQTHDTTVHDSANTQTPEGTTEAFPLESLFPWKEELEVMVRGGVPMALRGELWQAFVGAKARRVKDYYKELLAAEGKSGCSAPEEIAQSEDTKDLISDSVCIPEKWKGQIEKDLPRTFPGHPALDEDGRNALRRLLTAYARHNPSVGYCQAMNFFAGLLLLLMPEENAFWTLMGILDDYFDGYYSEEMIESQVDQLVLEELVRERFPKLVNHLDFLGVQIAWVTGPWFLSIFMNMLPWESVLRVWDVLLFEGNRVMLFRTALALMELYGPALVTTKDAGDAVTLLQSLAGSTFDSSQLVLTACMGYQNVHERRLEELRNKHRAAVIEAIEERSKGLQAWRDSQGLASKLYGFKHGNKSLLMEADKAGATADTRENSDLSRSDSDSANAVGFVISLTGDTEIDSVPDLQSQVAWLKGELCILMEEKRSAILRSEELETALMEMVQQDNRRELSAKVERLEQEVAELRQLLSDKQEQESAMLQVLMRVEQEQRVTEDARRFAEQDAAAQRYAAQVLQEKYEEAVAQVAEMEKRAIMAESMLEATLQYESSQVKAIPSPRSPRPDSQLRSSQEVQEPQRKISILSRPFALGWRDRNKAKADDPPAEAKTTSETPIPIPQETQTNGIETNGIEKQDKDQGSSS
ncbi:hypothetical protein MLD38_009788 [Melastoma candidum]|uniref:Uncharacterized protein n=1 Tax=Melastoma candidum TaxID=119954 RepID=A0ACB9RXT5_9MYRT|nr:hypothetical protein MLD38_009788 [Melastoma candidum]